MNAERFRTNVFLLALAGALALCVQLFKPFWPALAWAGILAILIYPTHRRIRARARRKTLAAALSTLLTVALIVLPIALFVFAAVSEGTRLVAEARVALDGGGGLGPRIAQAEDFVRTTAARLSGGAIKLSRGDLETAAQQQLGRIAQVLPGQASDFAARAGHNFIQIGFALVTLFFLLRDGDKLLSAVRVFIPLSRDQTDAVLGKAVETMYATFYGVVLVAMLQGTLGGMAFWGLGLPSPLLWGIVMTLLCIIPLAGAPVVWVPAALALAAQGQWAKAIILALWGWLVVGTVDNITRPFIIGGRTSLHPVAVFFAIMGGLFAVGGVGVFLGPLLLSVTLALLDILRLKLAPAPPGPPVAAAPPSSSVGNAPVAPAITASKPAAPASAPAARPRSAT